MRSATGVERGMRRYASAVVAFLFAGALVQSATAILALPGVPGTPRAYPWKKNIATTVFWIGPASGAPVHQESWKPEARKNPFYVALPFNDLQYPKLTKKWLPGAWTPRRQEDGRPTSSLPKSLGRNQKRGRAHLFCAVGGRGTHRHRRRALRLWIGSGHAPPAVSMSRPPWRNISVSTGWRSRRGVLSTMRM